MSACWRYEGSLNGSGYGPHRRVYERYVGPVGEGLELDHVCRNRWCVNPEHLEPVTRSENHIRKHKDSCPHGHPRNEQNTIVYNGHRYCRACRRRNAIEFRARRKAAA